MHDVPAHYHAPMESNAYTVGSFDPWHIEKTGISEIVSCTCVFWRPKRAACVYHKLLQGPDLLSMHLVNMYPMLALVAHLHSTRTQTYLDFPELRPRAGPCGSASSLIPPHRPKHIQGMERCTAGLAFYHQGSGTQSDLWLALPQSIRSVAFPELSSSPEPCHTSTTRLQPNPATTLPRLA